MHLCFPFFLKKDFKENIILHKVGQRNFYQVPQKKLLENLMLLHVKLELLGLTFTTIDTKLVNISS